jgi:hypothetical protein
MAFDFGKHIKSRRRSRRSRRSRRLSVSKLKRKYIKSKSKSKFYWNNKSVYQNALNKVDKNCKKSSGLMNKFWYSIPESKSCISSKKYLKSLP